MRLTRRTRSWHAIVIATACCLLAVTADDAAACSASVTFTDVADPRGYGVVIQGDSAYQGSYSWEVLYQGVRSYDYQPQGPGPFSSFISLDCRRIGTYEWRVSAGCADSPEGPGGSDTKVFTVVVPERPLTFKAELLDPPQPAGNVLVSYEFNRAMRFPNISVPGGEGRFVSNDGPGSFIVNLPAGKHRFVAYWCFGGSNGEQSMAIEVEVLPTLPIIFELDDASPPDQRTVLIARHRDDASYISSAQTHDGRLRVRANAGKPGRSIYFRVVDPPDSAAYIPVADRRPNDNKGSSGRLSETHAIANASGIVETELIITDRYAGDNYRVEASADPSFGCGAGCARTGVITAWKRVYVEKDEMFREGSTLAADAPAGARTIRVHDRRQFRRSDTVRLIHAPFREGTGPLAPDGSVDLRFWSETATIDRIERDPADGGRGILTLAAPLEHSYYIDQSSFVGDGMPYLNDGVGVITDNAAQSLFTMDTGLVAPAFGDAFTDYVVLSAATDENGIPHVPYVESLSTPQMSHFAHKWFENADHVKPMPVPPASANHQHLVSGRTRTNVNPGELSLGETTNGGGGNYSVIWVANIETGVRQHHPRTGITGLDARRVNAETVVHELVHQYDANPPEDATGGHCDQNVYPGHPHATQLCLMNSPANDRQKGDGIVALHHAVDSNGEVTSEYVTIRAIADPLP